MEADRPAPDTRDKPGHLNNFLKAKGSKGRMNAARAFVTDVSSSPELWGLINLVYAGEEGLFMKGEKDAARFMLKSAEGILNNFTTGDLSNIDPAALDAISHTITKLAEAREKGIFTEPLPQITDLLINTRDAMTRNLSTGKSPEIAKIETNQSVSDSNQANEQDVKPELEQIFTQALDRATARTGLSYEVASVKPGEDIVQRAREILASHNLDPAKMEDGWLEKAVAAEDFFKLPWETMSEAERSIAGIDQLAKDMGNILHFDENSPFETARDLAVWNAMYWRPVTTEYRATSWINSMGEISFQSEKDLATTSAPFFGIKKLSYLPNHESEDILVDISLLDRDFKLKIDPGGFIKGLDDHAIAGYKTLLVTNLIIRNYCALLENKNLIKPAPETDEAERKFIEKFTGVQDAHSESYGYPILENLEVYQGFVDYFKQTFGENFDEVMVLQERGRRYLWNNIPSQFKDSRWINRMGRAVTGEKNRASVVFSPNPAGRQIPIEIQTGDIRLRGYLNSDGRVQVEGIERDEYPNLSIIDMGVVRDYINALTKNGELGNTTFINRFNNDYIEKLEQLRVSGNSSLEDATPIRIDALESSRDTLEHIDPALTLINKVRELYGENFPRSLEENERMRRIFWREITGYYRDSRWLKGRGEVASKQWGTDETSKTTTEVTGVQKIYFMADQNDEKVHFRVETNLGIFNGVLGVDGKVQLPGFERSGSIDDLTALDKMVLESYFVTLYENDQMKYSENLIKAIERTSKTMVGLMAEPVLVGGKPDEQASQTKLSEEFTLPQTISAHVGIRDWAEHTEREEGRSYRRVKKPTIQEANEFIDMIAGNE